MREGCVLFDKSRRTRVVYMKKSRASACDMTLNLREHACEQPCGRAAWTSSLFCCMVVSPSLYRAPFVRACRVSSEKKRTGKKISITLSELAILQSRGRLPRAAASSSAAFFFLLLPKLSVLVATFAPDATARNAPPARPCEWPPPPLLLSSAAACLRLSALNVGGPCAPESS